MYTFSPEYNALYGHGIVIRHASVAGGAQREGFNFATVGVFSTWNQVFGMKKIFEKNFFFQNFFFKFFFPNFEVQYLQKYLFD